MVKMKRGEVVLRLAAQLTSWRAILVLLHTWATCKSWQRKDIYRYLIFLADCLNQSQQPIRESAGGAAATETRTFGKGRRKRRYADVDGPGANLEPELGPRGPTLKKQVLKEFDWLDLHLGLQPADSVVTTRDFEWEKETRAGDKDSSWMKLFLQGCAPEPPELYGLVYSRDESSLLDTSLEQSSVEDSEAMDPAGSPSSIRKVADTARPSSSSPPDSGWRSFFCLGNGK